MPSASMQPAKETLSGWLWKKHRKNQFWTGWHRRYFTLFVSSNGSASLKYYRNQRRTRQRGELTITSGSQISGGSQKSARHNFYRFEVFSATGDVILLAGKTQEETKKWIKSLNLAITSAPSPESIVGEGMVNSDASDPDDEVVSSDDEIGESGTPNISGDSAVGADMNNIKQGFLFRRPTFRRNFLAKRWHQRFFVLSDDGRLEWFRVNYKRGLRFKNLRGTVILGGDCVVEFPETEQRSQGHVFWPFRLLLGKKSRLLLGAESLDEARSWVKTLQTMIEQGTIGSSEVNGSATKSKRRKDFNSRRSVIVLDDMDADDDVGIDDIGMEAISEGNRSSENVLSLDHISEDGWLLKQQSSKTWRRRYFVLNGSKLALFKSSRSARPTTVVSLGSNCYVDFPGHSIVRGGRLVYPFTLFSERDDNFATFVDGALRLAAFTYDGASRWSNGLKQASILAPRERNNTVLSAFIEDDDVDVGGENMSGENISIEEGSIGPDGRTQSTCAPMPGQSLHYGDKIRLFTRSAYSSASTDHGGHVGVYESYKRKYGGMLYAVPPVGTKADFDFRTSTFVIRRVGEEGKAAESQVATTSRLRSLTVGRARSDSEEMTVRYGDEFLLVDLDHAISQNKYSASKLGYSSGGGSEKDEPGAIFSSNAHKNSSDVTHYSVNNGISRRSGYLGPRPLDSGGECRMIMTQTQKGARRGDPVCYGDSGVVIDIVSSKGDNHERFCCRLANFKKSTSKTVGGYLVAAARAESNVLTFRIDGEAAWLGLDLTRRYLVRAINCDVTYPTNGSGLLSSRVDTWWGPVAASEARKESPVDNSSEYPKTHNIPCINIRVGRTKHIQIRLPKRSERANGGTTSQRLHGPGFVLRKPVPRLPTVAIEWQFEGVNIGHESSSRLAQSQRSSRAFFFSLAIAMLIGSASGAAMQWARRHGASYDRMQAVLDGGKGIMYADVYVVAVSTAFVCLVFMIHATMLQLLSVGASNSNVSSKDDGQDCSDVDFWSFRLVKRAQTDLDGGDTKLKPNGRDSSKSPGGNSMFADERIDRMRSSSFDLTSAKKFLLKSTMEYMPNTEASMRRQGKSVHEAAGLAKTASSNPHHNLSEGFFGKWGRIEASEFVVRKGPDYKRNREKAPSKPELYEIISSDMFRTVLKPGHVGTRLLFPREMRSIICERHKLAQEAGITIPTVVINTWECPTYVPPNPLWSHKLDGESLNLLFVGVLSKQYIAEVLLARKAEKEVGSAAQADSNAAKGHTASKGKAEMEENMEGSPHIPTELYSGSDNGPPIPLRSHDLWARLLEGKEDGIRNRMKLITTLGNPDDICAGPVDRGLAIKFNSTPLLIRPQHEFCIGKFSKSDHHEDLDGIAYLDYAIDFHRFPYLSRVTGRNAMPKMHLAQMYFAVVVEARSDEELPERLLWCLHFEQLQINDAPFWNSDEN